MALEHTRTFGSNAAKTFFAASERMKRNYNVCLQTVINENPQFLDIDDDAFACPKTRHSVHEELNRAESGRRTQRIRHAQGIIGHTFLAQPAMLAAQMVMLEHVKECQPASVEGIRVVAGHSLGEISALAAIGVFPVPVAVDLVFKRGVLMKRCVDIHQTVSRKSEYLMFAVNPTKAQLQHLSSTPDSLSAAADVLAIVIEVISSALKQSTSFLELVNANIDSEQYVVAGDAVALSILGKVVDPQFRGNLSDKHRGSVADIVRSAIEAVRLDKDDGITMSPNKGFGPDFVPGSIRRYGRYHTFRRVLQGPDDGQTLSLDRLTHLTLEDDGRSGLKRKSWFIPLSVEVPFHSSLLRRAMDEFYPIVKDALPSDAIIENVLQCRGERSNHSPAWVTNLTGSAFSLADSFREEAEDFVSSQNVGECSRNGKYESTTVEEMVHVIRHTNSVREMMAVALASQLAHPVQWAQSMHSMVHDLGCRSVVEIAPQRTLADMFQRSFFGTAALQESKCMPLEMKQ